MRQLTKDENAALSLKINDMQATVVHTVKENRATDVRTELTWTFDFANASQEQILKLATRTICITQQARWRKAADRMDAEKWDNATFDVAALLAETRQAAEPKTKALNALQRLSDAERVEIMKALAETG